MPRTKTKAAPPPAPEPAAEPAPAAAAPEPAMPGALPTAAAVIYRELQVREYSTTSERGPLTPDTLRRILGWETEKDYQARMLIEHPSTKADVWLFRDDFHCYDTSGNKVRCWNNANNRPFDMPWCESLTHTILQGQWAGPHTIPGETINGEAIRISRYGRVLSGQHQGTACILADEILQKDGDRPGAPRMADGAAFDTKYPAWEGHDHCFIETLLVTGLSEDERVLQSIDYVKPRSLADMLYTMTLFRGRSPAQRRELTRMLAAATEMLWDRTGTRGYKTHTEMAAFLERHPRLIKCVEYLFIENLPEKKGGRRISKHRIVAGQAAALCYLMGSSGPGTSGDEYRNESPPCERGLDWSHWDRATAFWTGFARGPEFAPVRNALGRLVDSSSEDDANQGQGGRLPEKLAILAKAWEIYRDHPPNASGVPFTNEDLEPGGALCLAYNNLDDKGNPLPSGQIKLLDIADFYGIDCPSTASGKVVRAEEPEPPEMSAEEMDKAREDMLARRAAAQESIDRARSRKKR